MMSPSTFNDISIIDAFYYIIILKLRQVLIAMVFFTYVAITIDNSRYHYLLKVASVDEILIVTYSSSFSIFLIIVRFIGLKV